MADVYPPLADPPLENEVLAPDDQSRFGKAVRPRFTQAWQQFFTRLRQFVTDTSTSVTTLQAQAFLKQAVVSGGAAGNVTVSGIRLATSRLVAVTRYHVVSGDVAAVSDLTPEFAITADDTINNTGGTATTGDTLHVWWQGANP